MAEPEAAAEREEPVAWAVELRPVGMMEMAEMPELEATGAMEE